MSGRGSNARPGATGRGSASERFERAVRPFTNALFFPAATLYAALIVPWWTLHVTGLTWAPPGLAEAAFHAHEMIFGYALAVVAGYLLGPQTMPFNLLLLGVWVLARVSFLLWPGSLSASALAALFASLFAWRIVPRFATSARKWRNRSIVPLVSLLAVLCALAGPASSIAAAGAFRILLVETVLVLGCLMFFMGGRIIAPAVAGHLRASGRPLDSVVQPALEGAALIGFGVLLLTVPAAAASPLSGWAGILTGTLVAIRLLRWQPWRCFDRPDLVALLIGYAWLAIGVVLMGCSWLSGSMLLSPSIHVLTIGALGTLTLTVMIRTRGLYRYRDPDRLPLTKFIPVLLGVAALLRLSAGTPGFGGIADYGTMVLAAAACWGSACLLGLVFLLRTTIVDYSDGKVTIG